MAQNIFLFREQEALWWCFFHKYGIETLRWCVFSRIWNSNFVVVCFFTNMEQKLYGGVFFHEYGTETLWWCVFSRIWNRNFVVVCFFTNMESNFETKVANNLFPVFPLGYDHVHRDRIFFMQSDMTPFPSFSEIFFSNRHLQ